MENIIIGLLGVLILYLVLKLLKVSAKVIFKLVWNGAIGVILLYIFNALGSNIEMNVVNALIAGVFGIPGIILLLFI